MLAGDGLPTAITTSDYAYRFTGYINITTAGDYRFKTAADDRSRVYIGNNLVVEDDTDGTNWATGTLLLDLAVGVYPITVEYLNQGGFGILHVSYERKILGEEGYYIFEVDGKMPNISIDKFIVDKNVEIELKKLAPIRRKTMNLEITEN